MTSERLLRLHPFLMFFLLVISASGHCLADDLKIIPQPVSVKAQPGVFTLSQKQEIIFSDELLIREAEYLKDLLSQSTGLSPRTIKQSVAAKKSIYLQLLNDATIPAEGYRMEITQKQITISGNAAGIFYGIQTLKQLIGQGPTALDVPCAEINDFPNYSWRGMHLDVCRHFFPKDFIKKYIDFLAVYKMNTFHWHLTDDQGWRIEIKKYPKLITIGAWRNGTLIGRAAGTSYNYDSTRYGGYYSQEDIKEIIDYADGRHITIVPEIEMPGHCLAALAAYPEFSCTGGPFEVSRSWGVFDDVFCPKEKTLTFLTDVLSEVAALFPGKYIHIGGDECPKNRWHNCSSCQKLIAEKNLKDEDELQGWFIAEIEKFVNSKGKTIIGWDEILEGGLAPNAAVMSWRGTAGGMEAARLKHPVVMTPGSHCYFDHYQGDPRFEPLAIGGYTPIEKVYEFNPAPAELTLEEKSFILGAQGNVWTEYIASPAQVEYMIFPRICALSEVLWTPEIQHDWTGFFSRLVYHLPALDKLGINYARSVWQVRGQVITKEGTEGIFLQLNSNFTNGKICYTTDGFTPVSESTEYSGPIPVGTSMTIKAAWFENGDKKSSVMEMTFKLNKASGKNITLVTAPSPSYSNGGMLTLVDGIVGQIPWNGKEWLGFSGSDLDAVIDLGRTEQISKVSVGVLQEEASWIHLPESMEVFISTDSISFTPVKKLSPEEILRAGRNCISEFKSAPARYVRIMVKNAGVIPEGKPGAGNKAWLFVDEIGVE